MPENHEIPTPGTEMRDRVVTALVKRRNRSDIIRELCEQNGWDWSRGEEFVAQVEQEQAHAIAGRQTPMLIFLSAGTTLIGALLLGSAIQTITGLLKPELGDLLQTATLLLAGYSPIAVGITGLAMMAGGAIGMRLTLQRYFET